MKPAISVIGLGKLGAPIAVTIASRGFRVIGVDILEQNVAAINKTEPHIFEPQFSTFLKKYKKNFHATKDYNKALKNSDITLVVVPTPSKRNGSFSNKYVLQAVKSIGNTLKNKKTFHNVSIISTIIPHSMEKQILPALEKSSRKKVGRDIGLCYNPSFAALGNVIESFLNPDLVLIGQSDKKSGKILASFYQKLLPKKVPVKRMSFINAEITKIALNTYITAKISYANMLSQLCEKLPGANVDTITTALGFDKRIGSKYLIGGTSYGGPCFPRDNKALLFTGKKVGISLQLPKATDNINNYQIKRIANIISKKLYQILQKLVFLDLHIKLVPMLLKNQQELN